MKYGIKQLSSLDLPLLVTIENACHEYPMSTAIISSCFGQFYQVLGITLAEDIKGFAILHQVLDDASLMDICILPDHQGDGLGKVLLTAVVDKALSSGAQRLSLEVRTSNHRATCFYRTFGFKKTGIRRDYYQQKNGKEDAILMQLPLG